MVSMPEDKLSFENVQKEVIKASLKIPVEDIPDDNSDDPTILVWTDNDRALLKLKKPF
jgi:hypothetical protein